MDTCWSFFFFLAIALSVLPWFLTSNPNPKYYLVSSNLSFKELLSSWNNVFLIKRKEKSDNWFVNVSQARQPSIYSKSVITVKPVYKGHSKKPAMWPLWAGVLYIQDKLYVLLINGENETFSGTFVTPSLVFCVVFYEYLLAFFSSSWQLHCLSFLDFWHLTLTLNSIWFLQTFLERVVFDYDKRDT
jgi:hypothetical protein